MTTHNIHAVFVGIDHYQDLRIPPLQCAVRDAEAMCDMFQSIGATVELLTNSRATGVAIRRALCSLARAVDDDDTALFYFSGHGAIESLTSRVAAAQTVPMMLPNDTIRDDLLATAIQIEEVGRFLRMIPCKNVLFLFDSCYSGNAGNERSFPIPGMRGGQDGKRVMVGIAGEGTVVLTACGEYEKAYEDPVAGHGVFTEYILQGLKGNAPTNSGGRITLGSLYDFVATQVPKKTERLFNGYRQKPIKQGRERIPIEFPVMQEPNGKTLVNFPYDFLPITVVTGDRREPEPKTLGDVFVYSASPAELRWLLGLSLPYETEIVSDKVFMASDPAYLVEHYGATNLLVIGSPAANLLAREVNQTAFFPFAVDMVTREQWITISRELRAIGNDRPKLVKYSADPRTSDLRRYYMNQYRKGGFLDPTYSCVQRGQTIPGDKDYGVVTVCRNPYSPERSATTLAVMTAGVHLPGTMHAVRLLTRARTEFRERPLGGVFSVTLTDADWVKRIISGRSSWSTDPYDLAQMRDCLTSLKGQDRLRYVTGVLAQADVETRIAFLNDIEQLGRIQARESILLANKPLEATSQ